MKEQVLLNLTAQLTEMNSLIKIKRRYADLKG